MFIGPHGWEGSWVRVHGKLWEARSGGGHRRARGQCVCFLSVWLCSVDRFCPDGVSHGDKVQWVYNLIFSNISGKRIFFFFLLIMFIDKSQHRFVLALFQLCTNLSTSHCIQRKSVSIFCISHVVTKVQGLLLQDEEGRWTRLFHSVTEARLLTCNLSAVDFGAHLSCVWKRRAVCVRDQRISPGSLLVSS